MQSPLLSALIPAITRATTGWLTLGLSLWLMLAGAPQAQAQLAYAPGEVLSYRISWGLITAGDVRMAVTEAVDEEGRPVIRLLTETRSNRTVDVFYKVRDTVVSDLDPVTRVPYRIEIDQRHGRRKRILTTRFDQQARTATTYRANREPVQVDTPTGVQDILSALYHVRMLDDLVPGETVSVDVHEGRKNWKLLVHPIKRERIRTKLGRFDTVQVKAEVRFKGVFFDRGDIRIWFTDDVRHLPVRIHMKIGIGTVKIALSDITLPIRRAAAG